MLVIGILLVVAGVLALVGFIVWRRILRFAKGVERGLKMVPILINLPPPSDDSEVGGRDVRDVIQEKISQAEVLYNLIASTAKKGFKSKFYGQRHISFEIVAINGTIRFYTAVPVSLVSVIKQAVLTAYPGAGLEEVEEHNIFNPHGKTTGTIGGEIVLKEDYAYPIATFNQLKRDGMQALINAMSSLGEGDGAGLQVLLRPAHDGWSKHAKEVAGKMRKDKDGDKGVDWKSLVSAFWKTPEQSAEEKPPEDKQLSSTEQSLIEAIEEKTRHPGYEVLIRVVASSHTASQSQAILHNLVSSFALFDAPGMNGFVFQETKDIQNFITSFIFRFFPPSSGQNILNSTELATLFHLPDAQFTATSQVERQASKQVEGPSKIPQDGILLGYNVFRGTKRQIRLGYEDRRRHTYIIGQTGTGKTTHLENMAVQDMLEGRGFAFVDPHGDAAESLLTMVPKERAEDVIYFNPSDMASPMGLNLFEYHTPDQKDFLIQEAINMLYKLYDPQRQGIVGPRYEHLFRNAALTAMADPAGGTFIDIPKLFRDPQYVNEKLKHVTDKTVQEFWLKEMPQSRRSNEFGDVVSWFVSKFGAFLSNEMMRNIIGQSKSAFDLRDVMDNGKILIVNLSKGMTGELNSMLLGMIFIMKFQAAAMSRASVPESERKDFTLYVDEFQSFSTESFATILSEARKYHLNLVVANQYIGQLTEEIRDSVFGNVGTIISFRASPSDADFLAKQFAPTFDTQDIIKLPNFQAIVRLMIDGLPSQPFNMVSLPPIQVTNPQLAVALKQLSAAKYGRPRAQVEKEIFKRLESPAPPQPSMPPQRPPAAGPAGPAQRGRSSFLDEWLEKRKRQQQQSAKQQPAERQAPQPAPSPPPTQPESSQQPPSPAAKPSEPKTQPAPPPSPPPAASESSPPAPQTPVRGQKQPSASADAPRAQDQTAPDKRDQQEEPTGSQPTQRPTAPAEPAAGKETKEPAVPDLKPGEIYVDEAGNIHKG